MQEVTWYVSIVFLTLLQHETAVVLLYHRFFHYFHNRFSAALEAFLIISFLDVIWLYLQFLIIRTSFDKLSHIGRVHDWILQIQAWKWFAKLKPFFVNDAGPRDSGFKRMLKNSGHFGIVLCASLPGPGFKEIGIVMALAPKYKPHGFALMYFGGLIKTILTLLIYAGLYRAFEKLF